MFDLSGVTKPCGAKGEADSCQCLAAASPAKEVSGRDGEWDWLGDKGEMHGQSLHQAAPKARHKDKRFFSAVAGFKLDIGRDFFPLGQKDLDFPNRRGKGEAK